MQWRLSSTAGKRFPIIQKPEYKKRPPHINSQVSNYICNIPEATMNKTGIFITTFFKLIHMKFLKYFLLWTKHFFMYFGAWSMFYMINNINSEYSLKGLISSSFFALVLSFIVIISDILKDKNKKSDH